MEGNTIRALEDSVEYNEFFNAAMESSLQGLEAALVPSVDINALEANPLQGRAALHIAAQRGSVEVIQFLIAHGAKTDLRDSEYETPLHAAAFYAHADAVKILLDNGADIKLRTGDTEYTVMQNVLKYKNTITRQHMKTIELLLDRGADVNAEDGWGSNLLEHACSSHSIELVRLLIERGGHLKNALPIAVRNHDLVEYLLSQNAKIIGPPGQLGKWSAITNAAAAGNVAIIQMILSHADNTDLDASRDALMYAAAAGHVDMIIYLVEQGFDVNAFIKDGPMGETPLLTMFLKKEQYPQVITTLLQNGADPSVQSSKGDTPLHNAARWSNPEAVELLLNAGANTAIRNDDGDTPLIKLASHMSGFCLNYHHIDGRGINPRLETFRMVLEHTTDADINIQNSKGQTALHAVANYRHIRDPYIAKGRREAAKLLIKRGIDIAARDADGKTAGDLFVKNDMDSMFRKDVELVQLLGF